MMHSIQSVQSVQTVTIVCFAKKPLERVCFGGMFESQTHGVWRSGSQGNQQV